METKVYSAGFDGSCFPNPGGKIGIGGVIMQEEEVIATLSIEVPAHPINTNNVAEYMAFIRVLEFFIDMKLSHNEIYIQGDSMMVIEQMKGNWRIKDGAYKPQALKAAALVAQFPNLHLSWIPRSENAACDELSKKIVGDTIQLIKN